ncbi:MAG: MBL fold metallo-hydrolase [Muribaculaceae bacterium]|nr:MBL fold metallo-hydrolase [Muribaculaceae bacterium]
MLKIKQFAFGPLGVNTFVVYDSGTLDAIVVDPGMTSQTEYATFDKYISDNGLKVQQIVNTHLHMDHCFGDNYVRDKYGVKVAAHVDDAFLGKTMARQAAQFGLQVTDNRAVSIDVPLSDGDEIPVGQYTFKVIHVPGHSPGGLALYCAEGNIMIAGDTLFRGSIGRADLPGGDMQELLDSVSKKMFTLPDSTDVLPGHGGPTKIGTEKATNPFFN